MKVAVALLLIAALVFCALSAQAKKGDEAIIKALFKLAAKKRLTKEAKKGKEQQAEEADLPYFAALSMLKELANNNDEDEDEEVAAPVAAEETPAADADHFQAVSVPQLMAIMPGLKEARAQELMWYLNDALLEFGITSCERKSAFIAQVAHESGQLKYFEELATGEKYEGRLDLGNTQPGDGVRYKGRGPIQLTGRANYRAAGAALGLDLENDPTQAASKEVGFRIAAWFWTTRKPNHLNFWADFHNQKAFNEITYRVNGGCRGKAERDSYWGKARTTFGCPTLKPVTSAQPKGANTC